MNDRARQHRPAKDIRPGDVIYKDYFGMTSGPTKGRFVVDHVGTYKTYEKGDPRVSIKSGDRVFNHRPDDPIEMDAREEAQ